MTVQEFLFKANAQRVYHEEDAQRPGKKSYKFTVITGEGASDSLQIVVTEDLEVRSVEGLMRALDVRLPQAN